MPRTKNDGCVISYETMGDGPPVVMVYGVGGNARQWWDEFPRLMASRYRLVLIDNRGTGYSDKPESPWGMAEMTGDIMAVVNALGLDSFHLLSCSLGTLIARHLVKERGGGRIRSLTLLCPPNGIPATDEDLRLALFWDRTKAALDSARASWPVVHPESWVAANDALLAEKFGETLRDATPPRTFQFQLAAATLAGDPNPALHGFDWPVLVAHGMLDRLVPPANAYLVKAAVPRAELTMLDGLSHNFWQHAPERAADVVLSFLNRTEGGPGK